MAEEAYLTGASAYLERALKRLNERTFEALFYAALELRCCIEARQDLYLEAQKKYVRSRQRSWKIGPNNRSLNAVFKSNKIAKLELFFPDGYSEALFYTPVPKSLVERVQRLGDYLHMKQKHHAPDDPWWQEFRNFLVDTYFEAHIACKGLIISPAILKPEQNVEMSIDLPEGLGGELYMRMKDVGARLVIRVDYLDEPPSEWNMDLDKLRGF